MSAEPVIRVGVSVGTARGAPCCAALVVNGQLIDAVALTCDATRFVDAVALRDLMIRWRAAFGPASERAVVGSSAGRQWRAHVDAGRIYATLALLGVPVTIESTLGHGVRVGAPIGGVALGRHAKALADQWFPENQVLEHDASGELAIAVVLAVSKEEG